MNLEKMAHMISEIRMDLEEFNAELLYCDSGYMRICSRSESMADALHEAEIHGSILAYKGDVTAILPSLLDGWTKYGSPQ